VARGALAAGVAAAGLIGLLIFFASRDSSTFQAAGGPGQAFPDQGHRHLTPGALAPNFAYDSNPPTSGPHVPVLPRGDVRPLNTDELLQALEVGDVALVYGDRRLEPVLRRLANNLAGPYSGSLAAAGQAIVLDFQPGRRGVTGVAWRHLLHSARPSDPRLQAFIQFWLGRGAGG
jgi:hypothetical protein